MAKSKKIKGTSDSDTITGTSGKDNIDGFGGDDFLYGLEGKDKLNGGTGNDYLDGGDGNDKLIGGDGSDTIFGGDGNDRIYGDGSGSGKGSGSGSGKGSGKGSDADTDDNISFDDYLDGGAGSDIIHAGRGNDEVVYTVAENKGARDKYNGGSGIDTLTLNLTLAEWYTPEAQQDVADYLAFLAAHTDPLTGEADNAQFKFKAFGLKVRAFENLQVIVDGLPVDATAASDAVWTCPVFVPPSVLI